MLGVYTPVILLQAFCVYHAYRNNADYRWYWLIVLFPLIGCGIYLFYHFYNRRNIQTITESVKVVVNRNYKVEQLEKAFQFSDNLTNRLNLADAYVSSGRYDEALKLYRGALTGFMADDPHIRMKLLNALVLNQNYPEAVIVGEALESDAAFRNSEQRLAYAWALYFHGRSESAEKIFMSMDKSFTNYVHRREYCKFLSETGRTEQMKEKLDEMLVEFDHMKGPERRLHRDIIQEVRSMRSSLAPV